MLGYNHRLREIDGTLGQWTGGRGRAKQIRRDSVD